MNDQDVGGEEMDGGRRRFMERLKALLTDLPKSEREEALQYYSDYLDDAGKENEAAALNALGSPEQVAESIRRGLAETDRNRFLNDSGQSGGGFSGGGSYGGRPSGGPSYGGEPSGGPSYGGGPSGGPSYGGRPPVGPSYGGEPSGGPSSSGAPSYGGRTTMQQRPGRRRSAGWIVLMIFAALLFLPVLLPIALTAVVIAAAAVFSVFVALFCILIAGAVVFCVGIGLSIAAFMKMAVVPSAAVYMLGGGLICAGIGLAMTVFMIWVCLRVIPPMLRGLVNLCRMPFRKMKNGD